MEKMSRYQFLIGNVRQDKILDEDFAVDDVDTYQFLIGNVRQFDTITAATEYFEYQFLIGNVRRAINARANVHEQEWNVSIPHR